MLVKYNDEQVIKYPYTPEELYADNPNVYFPNLTNETLAPFNAANVVVTGSPLYDLFTQELVDIGCSYNVTTQRWETAWMIRSLNNDEMAERVAALTQSIVQRTQERLDTFARTCGYDGILSACTYAASTITKFQTEGQYCVNARDATWNSLYTIMADVQAGNRAMPLSYEDVEPELPVLAWPV
jgi:hypothetical protein